MTREQALAAGGDAPGFVFRDSASDSWSWASRLSETGRRCWEALHAGETSVTLVSPPGRVTIEQIEAVGRWRMV